MANLDNQSKKRYYPLRDSENPYKVSLVEITEAQYRALYPEIWATQKREQYHHRCMCPKKYIWKCDGNCDLCEYHTAGDMLSLDVPTEDGNANMYDTIPIPLLLWKMLFQMQFFSNNSLLSSVNSTLMLTALSKCLAMNSLTARLQNSLIVNREPSLTR